MAGLVSGCGLREEPVKDPVISISGTVSGDISDGVPITLIGLSALSTYTNPVITSGGGGYSFAPAVDGESTVIPLLPGYLFSPTSRTFTIDGDNQMGLDFTSTAITVSGTVSGAIADGVTLTLSSTGGSVISAGGGLYTFIGVPNGLNTITPSLDGYTFTPTSQTISVDDVNQTGLDFVATPITLSGTVSGAIADGVTMALTGAGIDSANTNPVTTTGGGNYSFSPVVTGSSTITPSLDGYTFNPFSRTIIVGGASQTGLDFVATEVTLSGAVSGVIDNGVTITLTGAGGGSATLNPVITSGGGKYNFSLVVDGDSIITPSLDGYTFTPPSRTVTVARASQEGLDFIATLVNLSGSVNFSAGGVANGVTMTLTGTGSSSATLNPVITSGGGDYSFSPIVDGDSTITPSLAGGFTFTPPSRTVTIARASQTDLDFTATGVSLSGRVSGDIVDFVTMTLTGAGASSVTTNPLFTTGGGNYSFSPVVDGDSTITPFRAGYVFSPPNRPVTVAAGASQAALDFTSTIITLSGGVSGAVSDGVRLTLSGAGSDSAISAGGGLYTFSAVPDGSNTITPTLNGYFFSPPFQTVNVSGANQTLPDFVATEVALSGTVSGSASDNVTMALTGAGIDSANTNPVTTTGGGNYSFSPVVTGSSIITPSASGTLFSPPFLTASVDVSSQTNLDFTSSAGTTWNIGGTVSGEIADGVTMVLSGYTPAVALTSGGGNYSFLNLAASQSYTIRPSLTEYTFSPPSIIIFPMADSSDNNFIATRNTYSLSGTLTGSATNPITVMLDGDATDTTITDSAGFYSFPGLFNGSYSVTPSQTGITFSPANTLADISGANGSGRDFKSFNAGFDISGTITYGGAETGRIYIKAQVPGCADCSPTAGTSISAAGAYTIRGVNNGTYDIISHRDNLGIGTQNALNPSGSLTNVVVNNAALAAQDMTLTDPGVITPMPVDGMTFDGASADSFIFLSWEAPFNGSGVEIAEKYTVYWDTTASVSSSTFTGSEDVPAGQGPSEVEFLHFGLTNGVPYYYVVTAVADGTESADSSVFGPLTPAVGGGTRSVSGAVTFPGSPSGSLYIGLSGNAGFSFLEIPSPTSPQSFTVSGVNAGFYDEVFAIIDVDGNGKLDLGDYDQEVNTGVDLTSGDAPGVDITLTGAASFPVVETGNDLTNGNYLLNLSVNGGAKRPVAVAITSGENIPIPSDVALNPWADFQLWNGIGNTTPLTSDAYTFNITYSDSTTETPTVNVSAVLGAVEAATPTFPLPVDNGNAITTPTFTWTAPALPPASYTYSLSIRESGGAGVDIWRTAYDLSSTTLSIPFNDDGTASGPLVSSTTYEWTLEVRDSNGNFVSQTTTWTP